MTSLSTWCCWLVLKPSPAKNETKVILIWGQFCAVERHLISLLHAVASKQLETLLQLDQPPVTKASRGRQQPLGSAQLPGLGLDLAGEELRAQSVRRATHAALCPRGEGVLLRPDSPKHPSPPLATTRPLQHPLGRAAAGGTLRVGRRAPRRHSSPGRQCRAAQGQAQQLQTGVLHKAAAAIGGGTRSCRSCSVCEANRAKASRARSGAGRQAVVQMAASPGPASRSARCKARD